MSYRVAIVTGGTGALGSVVVAEFVRKGMGVGIPVAPGGELAHAGEKRPEGSPSQSGGHRGDPSISGSPPSVLCLPADLRREEDVTEFVRAMMKEFGRIDILVNIAGGYAGGNSIQETSVAEWDAMMELNLKTAFLMCRRVIPFMNGFGRIVNIAAMPALLPAPRRGAYTVSKAGIVTLTEVIHQEVKGSAITVNAIAPSILLTEANRASMPGADTSKWVPLSEVASLILYLCSDEARSVSGNTIRIFGGV